MVDFFRGQARYEGFDMTPKQDYRTINGKPVRREDFAWAPAGSEPSEWKLAIDDDNINAAMDMFAHADIPAEERHAVAQRIADRAEESVASAQKKERTSRRTVAWSTPVPSSGNLH